MLNTWSCLALGLLFIVAQAQMTKRPWEEFPLPTAIHVQNEASGDDMPLRVLQHTLSGLVTRATVSGHNVPSLWIRTGSADDMWRSRFVARTGIPTQSVSSNVIARVKAYADLGVVKGFVAYAPDTTGNQQSVSVNIATSLCGPLGAVAAGGYLVDALASHGLTQLANASQLTYPDIMNGTYDYNQDLLTILRTEQPHARDLAVASGTLVTVESSNGGYSSALDTLNPGAAVFGYGADEHAFTYGASTVGAGVVGCDWSSNLATLSSGPQPIVGTFPPRTPVTDDGTSFYVAFVITDGDNLQWTLNDFTWGPFWFASQFRGTIPFTWGLHTSALAQLAPDALSWFQSVATANDSFIPYADSYAYLDVIQSTAPLRLPIFVSERQPWSHLAGLHSTVVFMDDWRATTAYETFITADPAVKALFPVQYSSYAVGEGALLRTSSGVPALSAKISLWDLGRNDSQFGDPDHVAEVLNMWASNSSTQGIEGRVAWVPVHAWSTWNAPPDGQDIATNGRLGGYSAALYAGRKLGVNVKIVTLDDVASLLGPSGSEISTFES